MRWLSSMNRDDDDDGGQQRQDDDDDTNLVNIITAAVDGNNNNHHHLAAAEETENLLLFQQQQQQIMTQRGGTAVIEKETEDADHAVIRNDEDHNDVDPAPPCDDPTQQQYRERPGRQMVATWCFGIMMPCAVAAWYQTTGQVWITMAATFAAPALAIIQGAMGILTYRVFYGDAPIPASPSHGVVVVRGPKSPSGQRHPRTTTTTTTTRATAVDGSDEVVVEDNIEEEEEEEEEDDDDTYLNKVLERPPIRLLVVGDSLAVGVGQSGQATPVMPEVIAKTISKNTGRVVYWTCHGAPGASAGWIIRELERGVESRGSIGDIEEEDDEGEEEDYGDDDDDDDDYQLVSASPNSATTTEEGDGEHVVVAAVTTIEAQSTCSETDESSSTCSSDEDTASHSAPGSPISNSNNNDEPTTSLTPSRIVSNSPGQQSATSRDDGNGGRMRTTVTTPTASSSAREKRAKRRAWRERLAHHKKRFDNPDLLGPYDIAVVLTGSNDLKSAFFPFLLTGEDREFRRQAQQRGGSYATDLRLVRDTLNGKMQRSIEEFRHRVEHAAEHAFERMAEQIPLMVSPRGSSSGQHDVQQPQRNRSRSDSAGSRRIRRGSTPMTQKEQEQLLLPLRRRIHSETTASTGTDYGSTSVNSKSTAAEFIPTSHQHHQQHFPLVVFPGMPARALPIFRCRPLRWLAIPIVDIMDMHKRRLAMQHPGQVLFVRAPTPTGVTQYEKKTGASWSQRCEEETILELRDIRKRDRRRIESDMHAYYRRRHPDGGSSNGDPVRHPTTNVNEDVSRGADAAVRGGDGSWRSWARSFFSFASPSGTTSSSSSSEQQPAKCFSVDQIHPTDDGYDFWGRHIGRAIVEEKRMSLSSR